MEQLSARSWCTMDQGDVRRRIFSHCIDERTDPSSASALSCVLALGGGRPRAPRAGLTVSSMLIAKLPSYQIQHCLRKPIRLGIRLAFGREPTTVRPPLGFVEEGARGDTGAGTGMGAGGGGARFLAAMNEGTEKRTRRRKEAKLTDSLATDVELSSVLKGHYVVSAPTTRAGPAGR